MEKNPGGVFCGRIDPICEISGQARLPRDVRPSDRGKGHPDPHPAGAGLPAYDYYFSAQDENELLLIERWQSAEHQRVHMQQPHMQQLRAIKEQYVDSTTLGKVRLEA